MSSKRGTTAPARSEGAPERPRSAQRSSNRGRARWRCIRRRAPCATRRHGLGDCCPPRSGRARPVASVLVSGRLPRRAPRAQLASRGLGRQARRAPPPAPAGARRASGETVRTGESPRPCPLVKLAQFDFNVAKPRDPRVTGRRDRGDRRVPRAGDASNSHLAGELRAAVTPFPEARGDYREHANVIGRCRNLRREPDRLQRSISCNTRAS